MIGLNKVNESYGQNVTVDILMGSKCHSGRSEFGRNVQAAFFPVCVTKLPSLVLSASFFLKNYRNMDYRNAFVKTVGLSDSGNRILG